MIAGISITLIINNEGVIIKAAQAKAEISEQEAEEKLKIELANILAENQGDFDLKNLDGIKVQDYDTNITDICRIVSMQKNGETYVFMVYGNYNVIKLDVGATSSIGGNGNGSGDSKPNEGQYELGITESVGDYIKLSFPEEISTREDIVNYIYLKDGNIIKSGETLTEYAVSELEENKSYVFQGMVIDNKGNVIKSVPANYTKNRVGYNAEEIKSGSFITVQSIIGKQVRYKNDNNWSVLYVGNKFSTDGNHIFLISKTARQSLKLSASGAYNNTVMRKTASGANLSNWSKANTGGGSNANGAAKTWYMLTSSNYNAYLDSDVAEWAIGGPTPELYYEAQNIKRGTSYSASYNATGYIYNAYTNFTNIAGITSSGGFWLAGPGSYGNGWVMLMNPSGSCWCYADKDGNLNLIPVVCLKKTTKLVEAVNGIYNVEAVNEP